MISIVEVPDRYQNLLPDNNHHYDDRHRPTGADWFRVAYTVIIPVDGGELRRAYEDNLIPEFRAAADQEYGLVLLESQTFSATAMVGADAVRAHRDAGVKLPSGPHIVTGAGWPDDATTAWDNVLPTGTWYPGGAGILDTYTGVDGATVTLYEYSVDKAQAWDGNKSPSGETISMVTWHCDRCHTPSSIWDLDGRYENNGPHDRKWASREARVHARGADGKCTPPDPRITRAVEEISSKMRGRPVSLPDKASSCAASDGCARIRHAKMTTAPLIDAARRNS